MKVLESRYWRAALGGILGAMLFLGSARSSSAQQIDLDGKDTKWEKVGSIPKLTPFNIQASGMVDFGGILHNNNDGVTAGVTGNAFWKGLTDAWPTIEQGLIALAEVAAELESSTGEIKADSATPNTTWAWQTMMSKATVNYDEGGFWVAIMTADHAPQNASDASLAAQPALYYWYNQILLKNIVIAYHKDVYVYVRQHDGGHDPFHQGDDWSDNSGTYTISLFTIDTPLDQLVKDGKADSAHVRGPLQMKDGWTPPTPFATGKNYILLNVQTNGLLHGNARAAGGDVGQSGDQDSHEQWWQSNRQTDGSYTLQNVASKGFLKGTDSGLQESAQSDASTRWKPVASLDGTYTFMNMQSKKYLTGDPQNAVSLSATNDSAAQKWKVFAK